MEVAAWWATRGRLWVAAVNALRARHDYLFTTGGIGPTHDDITAECVAKAFGVPISHDPRAIKILTERLAQTGSEMNEARMRMTRIPQGLTSCSTRSPRVLGFWLGNASCSGWCAEHHAGRCSTASRPSCAPGVKMLSDTIRADAREGEIGTPLGEIAKAHPDVMIGSYPFLDEARGANTNVVMRARDPARLAAVKLEVEAMLARVRGQR